MKKRQVLILIVFLIFSLILISCKSKSNQSSSTQVPENEGVAYFLEFCGERWPNTTFQIEEVLEVTNHYDIEDIDQAYCIGSTTSKNDEYNIALVYEIDGEWDVNWSASIDRTCADEFK